MKKEYPSICTISRSNFMQKHILQILSPLVIVNIRRLQKD